MPAVSKQQQKFFGLVRGVQEGKIKPKHVSARVRKAANTMTTKQAHDFAVTPRKGLPKKVTGKK